VWSAVAGWTAAPSAHAAAVPRSAPAGVMEKWRLMAAAWGPQTGARGGLDGMTK